MFAGSSTRDRPCFRPQPQHSAKFCDECNLPPTNHWRLWASWPWPVSNQRVIWYVWRFFPLNSQTFTHCEPFQTMNQMFKKPCWFSNIIIFQNFSWPWNSIVFNLCFLETTPLFHWNNVCLSPSMKKCGTCSSQTHSTTHRHSQL